MAKSNAISIYGVANKIIRQSGYTYQQRKRVPTHTRAGHTVKSYLRKTGHTVTVKAHINYTKPRETRFTIYGTAKQCKKAQTIIQKEQYVPKSRYQDRLNAAKFLKHPEKYVHEGKWKKQETKPSP